jgi:hypothetical protein
MAIRILEEDEREKYEARRREMVLSHTTVIMNGLLETPEAQEERERKARRDVRTEAREVADRAECEAQYRKWKEVQGCDISIDHVVDVEKSALRQVSSESSFILPSQMVSDILKHMLLLNKDANDCAWRGGREDRNLHRSCTKFWRLGARSGGSGRGGND